jgi:hypothetical protein
MKRRSGASLLALLAVTFGLVCSGTASAAAPDPPPLPKPTPKPTPPPSRSRPAPPSSRPAPPAPVQPAPVQPAPAPPPAAIPRGPSASELAARRRADAAARVLRQKAKAKRLALQRDEAAAEAFARKRELRLRQIEAREESRLPGKPGAALGSVEGQSSGRKAVPFVAAAFIAALFVLGLGLVPAYVVPWYRASMVLEEHREQFALAGGMAVLATGVFFALIFLGG